MAEDMQSESNSAIYLTFAPMCVGGGGGELYVSNCSVIFAPVCVGWGTVCFKV